MLRIILQGILGDARSAGSDVRCSSGDEAMVRRFRWDFQQTISELLAENYVGRLAELAHEHGLRLSMEGYDLPFGDEGPYTASADEPMSEFWTGKSGWSKDFVERKGGQMASVAMGLSYGSVIDPLHGADSTAIAELLSIVHFQPASINRVLKLLNDQFFLRADAIINANSQSGSVGLGVGQPSSSDTSWSGSSNRRLRMSE